MPMSQDKVSALLHYLDQEAGAAQTPMQHLVFQRDAIMALLMWETCLRGVNCGKLSLDDFFLPTGRPAQLPLPEHFSLGSVILLRPNGSKAVKGARAGVIS